MSDITKLRRRGAAFAVLAMLVPAVLVFSAPAAARDDPKYCENNPGDPRCNPEYCQFNPDDPWCWDPDYCERFPSDPICHKEPGEKKEVCMYTMLGLPAILGATPGPTVTTLDCPNHILAKWECGWKDATSPLPVDPTPTNPVCVFLGETPTPTGPCSKEWSWLTFRPDVRTVTAWHRAHMWKDENCDGRPDDWNTSLPGGGCALPNEYGPKTGWPWYPYAPRPDGRIDACDQQHYEWQWRSFN